MGHKKKPESISVFRTILNAAIILPTLYNLVGKVFTLASYEAKLAGKSLIKIIIIAIVCGVIGATTWLCLLGMYALFLISLGWSYQATLSIIVLINLLILVILGILIKYAEKNLSFRATRYQIRRAFKKEE